MIIYNEDYTMVLDINNEQFEFLNEALEYEDDTDTYSLEHELFNVLSVGMQQAPKIVVGEDEEGNTIVFEPDDRVLN